MISNIVPRFSCRSRLEACKPVYGFAPSNRDKRCEYNTTKW